MRDANRKTSVLFQMVSALMVIFFLCSSTICLALMSEARNPAIENHIDGSSNNAGQISTAASLNGILFWTQIPPVNQEAAMQAGTIDGGVSWEPFCSVQVIDNAAKILTRSGNIMADHPSDLLAVHYNYQFSDNETNQQLVARVVRAHLEATDWIVKTINEGAGANYTILVQMAAQFTGLSQSDIHSALEHVGYKYAINQAYKDGLADFTSMFANLSVIVGFGGYSNATDFANGITNTSYQDVSSSLSPSSTILGTVRIGYLNGNLRSLAEIVAKNTSLWGGRDLFQVWGVEVTSPLPYANGGQEMNAFAAGNIDMGYLGCAQAILKCINSNIPIEIVSAANTEGSAILVRPDISTLNGLNLRTLATPGPGSIEHLLLLKWAAMNGFEVYLKGTVEVPSAPRDPNATAINGNITLRWLEPENSGGTSITNYTIYRGTSSGDESILVTIGPNLSFVDSAVIRGPTYYYKVSAVNLVGEGAQSNETSAQVPAVPSTPLNLSANGDDGFCALSWEAPSDPGLGGLTYHLFRDSQLIWNGSGTSHNDTTVTNGMTYHYTVAANNSIGWSANSSSVTFTPQGPPTAPRGLETNVGNNEVDLNWTAPSYTGPGTLIYHLFRNGVVVWNGTSIAHNDTGLVNGHIYEYKVAAQNDIGWSANSSSLPAIPLGVPNAPGNLHVTIGVGYINLTWSPPSNNGGTPILNYTIMRGPAPSPAIPWIINASTGVTWYNDTSVVAGTAYNYYVTASNQKGESDVSTVAATAAAAPSSTSNDWMLYVGIGAIVIVAMAGVAFVVLRKRK